MPLGADSRLSEVSQERPRDVALVLPSRADLHREVSVLLARLVRDDLHTVELEDGAGGALAGLRVVNGGHALLDAHRSRSQGEGEVFSF